MTVADSLHRAASTCPGILSLSIENYIDILQQLSTLDLSQIHYRLDNSVPNKQNKSKPNITISPEDRANIASAALEKAISNLSDRAQFESELSRLIHVSLDLTSSVFGLLPLPLNTFNFGITVPVPVPVSITSTITTNASQVYHMAQPQSFTLKWQNSINSRTRQSIKIS
ncbi:hypothetical protein D9758_015562 [Tetrapyrgos nigripes]|uniref:Uncharacterized protein n=1 Tax=Tetrapyrgos nigripes TaxID=182062 RepID=A0A8H5CBU4_9AGAR|nr:hypothetical protein D9758_015562 [Tetrapyrgos nigripes]